jgi:hypothetical protein
MNKDLRKALDQLRKAVEDEGREPQYHRRTARLVEVNWPAADKR